MLKGITAQLGHGINFTPHSCRAGFASEGRMANRPYSEIKEEGRWISDASFRTYIDVVSAAAISQTLALKGLSGPLHAAVESWSQYFAPQWLLSCDHASGVAQTGRSTTRRSRSP